MKSYTVHPIDDIINSHTFKSLEMAKSFVQFISEMFGTNSTVEVIHD